MEDNPSHFKGDSLPVENVSWNDCQGFIKKLNSITGKNFSLPTEAQWEFAARGGVKSKGFIYSGSNNIDEVACKIELTYPVASKKANELGLYDMTGNGWEWCNDRFSNNYYFNSPKDNPQGPISGSSRVLRSSSCGNNARYCRISHRSSTSPNISSKYIGLRLVL